MPSPTSLEEYLAQRRGDILSPRRGVDAGPTAVDVPAAGGNPFLAAALRRQSGRGVTTPTRSPVSASAPAPSRFEPRGQLSSAFSTLTQPLRTLTGLTGSLGGQVARFFDPVGYEEARRDIQDSILRGENRELTTLEQGEALPGLGDVIGTHISDEGITGRLFKPVATLGLNIASDPTSYIGLGLAPRLFKAGSTAAKVAQGVEALGEAGAAGRALAKGQVGRALATVPFGPIPGVAYAPDLIESVGAGVQRTVEDAQQGRLAEAAASGAGTLLTSALGLLVAKGTLDEATAARTARRALAHQAGLPTAAQPQPGATAGPIPEFPGPVDPKSVEPEPAVEAAQPSAAPIPSPTPAPPAPSVAPAVAPTSPRSAIFDEFAESGQPLSIATMLERGVLTEAEAKKAHKFGLASVLNPEEMERLDFTPGKPRTVKRAAAVDPNAVPATTSTAPALPPVAPAAAVEAPPAAVAETIAPVTPAAPAAPARVPRAEADRQLATPEQRAEVDNALAQISEARGKSLMDLSPEDVRQALPGADNKDRRRILNRALTAVQKIRREEAKAAEAAEAATATPAVPAAEAVAIPPAAGTPTGLEVGTDTPTATATTPTTTVATAAAPGAVGEVPATPALRAGPDSTASVVRESTAAATAAAPAAEAADPFPDLPADFRAQLAGDIRSQIAAADAARSARAGRAPFALPPERADLPLTTTGADDLRGPARFTDADILSRQTERAGGRVTSPTPSVSEAQRERIAKDKIEAEGQPLPPLHRKSTDLPLDSPEAQRAASRLADRKGRVRYQDRAVRLLDLVNRDPATLTPIERRARHLMLDEPDEELARKHLQSILKTGAKFDELAATRAANRDISIESPSGEIPYHIERAALGNVAEGLSDEEASRLSIKPATALDPIEAAAAADRADPDYPERPAGVLTEDWHRQIAESPDVVDGYRNAMAWALDQWKTKPKKTGTTARSPHMEVLHGIARDLGVDIPKGRGADRIIVKIANKLDEITGRDPRASVTDLLTDEIVATRRDQYDKAIAAGRRLGDTDARVVDFEGDGAALIDSVSRHSGPLGDALVRATSSIGDTIGLPSRFGGLAVSPQLNGVRVGDGVYLNPLAAMHRAASQGLEGDKLRYHAAEDMTDTLIHELAHRKARHDAATGDATFIEAYASALEDAGPLYSSTIRELQSALESGSDGLRAAIPAYLEARRKVVESGSVARNDAGTGRGRIAPIPDRQGRGEGGAARSAGDGTRSSRTLLRGDRAPTEGVRGGAADLGRAAGGGDRELDGRAGGAAPAASLTDAVFEGLERSRRERRIQIHKEAYAETLARATGQSEAAADQIIADIDRVQKMSESERAALRAAGPGELHNIGLRLSKFADTMSPEQIEALAATLEAANYTQPRGTPMRAADVDAETREFLEANSPEEAIQKLQKAGLSEPRDFAVVKSVIGLYGEEVDRARESVKVAQIRKNPEQLARAMDELGQKVMARDNAINMLIPNTTKTARILAFQRMMAHPLTPDETFATRFLGAMRASRIPEDKAKQFLQLFKETAAQGAAANWDEFTRQFRQATNPKMMDRFLEFWKAGLLGIPTQLANIGSNTTMFGMKNLEQGLSTMANAFLDKVTGSPRTRYVGEVAGRMRGLRDAMSEALPMLRDDLSEIAALRSPDVSRRIQRGSFMDDPNLRQLTGAIPGKTGEFTRIPFKLLDTSDNVQKHALRLQEYGAQSVRLANDPAYRSPGESVEHAANRIYGELKRIAADPIQSFHLTKDKPKYKQAIEAGKKAALEGTYQARPGKLLRGFDEFVKSHPALEFLFPFRKTPYNILTEGMKRTPLAALDAARRYRAGEIDRPEFVEAMVRSSLGASVMGVVAGYALDGTITGGGPTDPKQQELLKRTGWQPYSIKVGNQYISYQRMEPIATLLGISADMTEAWKRKDMDTAEELMTKAVTAASDNILSKTFLQGLESLVNLTTGNKPGGRAAAVRQLQASLIPNIIGVVPVAHAARATDPFYRETEAGTFSPFAAQIPGLSTSLQPQYSPSGEKRVRKGTPIERLISPFSRSEKQTDAGAVAAEELVRLGRSMERPPLYLKLGNEKVYYTPEERELLGQAQEKALTRIGELVQTPAYTRLPDADTLAGGTHRPNKGDAIQRVRSHIVQPVVDRINRQALNRAREQARGSRR